jgi:hypothetical protein
MTADSDILALLKGAGLNVHDGYVKADETAKVISVALPYVVFYSSPGYDNDLRFFGAGGRVLEFQVTAVGATREQAKWALDKARVALSRQRLGDAVIRRSDDNAYVRRDDDYTRPGGGPLFYGVDRYGVAVVSPAPA